MPDCPSRVSATRMAHTISRAPRRKQAPAAARQSWVDNDRAGFMGLCDRRVSWAGRQKSAKRPAGPYNRATFSNQGDRTGLGLVLRGSRDQTKASLTALTVPGCRSRCGAWRQTQLLGAIRHPSPCQQQPKSLLAGVQGAPYRGTALTCDHREQKSAHQGSGEAASHPC